MATTARKGIAFELERHNAAFSLWFMGIFTLSFVFLAAADVVPDPTAHWNNEHGGVQVADASQTSGDQTKSTVQTVSGVLGSVFTSNQNPVTSNQSELPVKIVADSINLAATIGNPTTSDDTVMNQFLKSGAVRYPTSGVLGVDGTVLLFGHSSYLPVVANQAYKTFDDIQNLHKGDEVSVYSATREYRYSVTSVTLVHASNGIVNLKSDGQYLTLVTCDSFDGNTHDRWIVESKLVGIYSLANH